MKHKFWHDKWKSGQLGFHQEKVNSRLIGHWQTLGLNHGEPVFVPLCGKSLDMLWLAGQGHPVFGLELSESACRAFYDENKIPYRQTTDGPFVKFRGNGVEIWCGDFFDLVSSDLSGNTGVYDRASLIALPAEMRIQYANHLTQILDTGTRLFLISMDYNESEMNGPPFSVPEEEVRRLFESDFEIKLMTRSSGPEIVGNLAARGLTSLNEKVYQLKRQ